MTSAQLASSIHALNPYSALLFWSQRALLGAHHFLLLSSSCVSFFSPFLISALLVTDLFLCFVIDVSQINSDAVCSSQIPFSEIFGHPIALNSFTKHLKEFLFDAQVVVGDRQHCNSIFEFLLHLHFKFILFFCCLFFLLVLIWKEMEKQRRLYYHDGLSRVVQRQVVSVQLRQYSTCIQMRVGLSSSL